MPLKYRIDNSHTVREGAISSAIDSELVYVDSSIPQYSILPSGWRCHNWYYLAVHELNERHAMLKMGYRSDMSEQQKHRLYLPAHSNYATPAERNAVECDGGRWKEYQAHMNGLLSKIEHEDGTNPPPDPFLDAKAVFIKGLHKGRFAA